MGGHPGIPLKVELIEAERAINDTNKLWHPAASFPQPDESNPVIGLESAEKATHDFESEVSEVDVSEADVSGTAIEKDGAA